MLILDDVLSELDRSRQKKLMTAVDGVQTIFTTTGVTRSVFKGFPYRFMTVENGKIKSCKDF